MKIKTLCALFFLTLTASLASAQSVTRCGGPTTALYINWPMFHLDVCHTGNNPYEHILSPSTVGSLVQDWFHHISDNPVTSSPALVNGVVYIVTNEGTLYALNATNDATVWMKAINANGNVAVVNGVLYVSSLTPNDRYVYALDAATGNVIWQYEPPFTPGSPTVADGIVYVPVYTSLYALDARTGALIWQQATGPTNGSPAVVNGLVYTGSAGGTMYALNARTGASVWQSTVLSADSSPAVFNGVVYVNCYDFQNHEGVVYALNALTGAFIWRYELGPLSNPDSAPAVANGIVYESSDYDVTALDAGTGVVHWKVTTGYGYGQSAPAVANGVVYLGSALAHDVRPILALDAGTGAVLWRYAVEDPHPNLSSPVVANSVLYVGTADGYLFAFHLPNQ